MCWLGLLFVLHQLGQKVFYLYLPFVDAYFDPFVCSLFGLFAAQKHFAYLSQLPNRQLAVWEILLTAFLLSIISEEIFPRLSSEFTRDMWDYVAFASGALAFYFWQKKRASSEKLARSD